MNLTEVHKLRKLYKKVFDIGRFPSEKRTPFSGLDVENTTDPISMNQRDLVSVWFNPKNPSPNAKVPHEEQYLVFQAHQDIEESGNFHGKPKIDLYRPGDWEEILEHLWNYLVKDENEMRKT